MPSGCLAGQSMAATSALTPPCFMVDGFARRPAERLLRLSETSRSSSVSSNTGCQSVHLHLKKCGGTTTHHAVKNAQLLGPRSNRFSFTDRHHQQLRTIYEHQVNLTLPTIPVFTLIRDPVSTFFSGLNQFQALHHRFPSTHPITVALGEDNDTRTMSMFERVIESIHITAPFSMYTSYHKPLKCTK
jgi:hypothetical protein